MKEWFFSYDRKFYFEDPVKIKGKLFFEGIFKGTVRISVEFI